MCANLDVLSLRPRAYLRGHFNNQHKYNMIYKKNIESTDKFIHELTEEEVTIAGLSYTTKKGEFFFDGTYLSFLLNENMKDTPPNRLQLHIHTKSRTYKTSNSHVLTYQYHEGETLKSRSGIIFYQLMDSQWKEKEEYYYRFLLPFDEKNWSNFKCSTDHEILIRISFSEEKQIHIFPMSNHLVIESQFSCRYRDMHDYMYAVSLSLGLATSVAPSDYAFIIASETPDFERQIMGGLIRLRPTIKDQNQYIYQYAFFTTNAPSLYKSLREGKTGYTLHQLCDENGRVKDRLDPMTEQEFSVIARMLYENKELARATLILLSAPIDFDLMGAIYSVVLETICSALTEDKEGTYMESKDWKSVLLELKKTLSDFCEEHSITDEHKEVMIKKLDGFNSQTNGDKLTAPFERIGYKLSSPEKKVIRDRNRFLHGKAHECLSNESYKNDRQLYVSMELRKLCGILLFRYAGYKGPILNNAVALELKEAIENKEPLFITYDEKTESPQPTEEPEASV